jgi:NAD(P)-dependent dehydrogenase (short-subunit alcohol dehydrogenase family)
MQQNASPWPAGRVALVTGASAGIGRVTALELARHGFRLFLACRSRERTQPVIESIRATVPAAEIEWLPLELADFVSVNACAEAFLERSLPLHLLVNNAGLAGSRGRTPSGFESGFGINHMGHFLLTLRLLDRIRASAPARIVTVASRAHKRVQGIDWEAVRKPTATALGVREYGVSKLANVLFSAELGRRLQGSGVTSYSLHPGVVDSEIWRTLSWPLRMLNRLRLVSPEEGAKTTIHCAVSEEAATQSGLYYSECKPIAPSPVAQDMALAAELWRRSSDWVRDAR